MDRFNQFISRTFIQPAPLSQQDMACSAVKQVISLSAEKTCVEQLAAFAYAWGSVRQEADDTYRKSFESSKNVFLDAASDTLESRKRFSQVVRAGIRAQFPFEISQVLEKVYRNCENRLDTENGYTYKNMKADMLGAIRKLIRQETGNIPQVQSIATATTTAVIPLAHLPSSATTATSPVFQPAATPPSICVPPEPAPEPPPEYTPVVVAPTPIPGCAPPHLAFLDSFPLEWRADSAWTKVIASTDLYFSSFASYRGPGQIKLLEANPEALVKAVRSIKLYTALPADEAAKVAHERELVNMEMDRPFTDEINLKVLGCVASRMKESLTAQTPGNQLSLSMRVPMLTVDGRTCSPVILSVSAPALDIKTQPEWKHYVKDGHLDEDAYRLAFQTLASHIKLCAAEPENEGAQVVLSGFGLANFLGSLSSQERNKAVALGAEVFIPLIGELRGEGVGVAYTDGDGSSPPWPTVNAALGSNPLQCVGKVPGRWIKDKQIIVNAWDPHALVGNGCANDRSLDGFIGRNSLVHETHALACVLHTHGFIS